MFEGLSPRTKVGNNGQSELDYSPNGTLTRGFPAYVDNIQDVNWLQPQMLISNKETNILLWSSDIGEQKSGRTAPLHWTGDGKEEFLWEILTRYLGHLLTLVKEEGSFWELNVSVLKQFVIALLGSVPDP